MLVGKSLECLGRVLVPNEPAPPGLGNMGLSHRAWGTHRVQLSVWFLAPSGCSSLGVLATL